MFCNQCRIVYYCSPTCQRKHWTRHAPICKCLHLLAKGPSDWNSLESVTNSVICHLSPKQQIRLSSLVGKKCIVNCKPNIKNASVLWDTRSQVSLISRKFLKENFPSLKIRNLTELLDFEDLLDLRAANNTPVPFDGFAEFTFELSNVPGGDVLAVPFLVSNTRMANPIIGYNVIEKIVKSCCMNTAENDARNTVIVTTIQESFEQPTKGVVQDIIDIICEEQDHDLATIKSPKWVIVIPAKRYSKITCRGNAETCDAKTKVLFVPNESGTLPTGLELKETLFTLPEGYSFRANIEVYNSSEHVIILNGKSVLGHVELVKSVTPISVKLKNEPRLDGKENPPMNTKMEQNERIKVETAPLHISAENNEFLNQFDLSFLSAEQKQSVYKVLLEESDSFAQGDREVGCATGLNYQLIFLMIVQYKKITTQFQSHCTQK